MQFPKTQCDWLKGGLIPPPPSFFSLQPQTLEKQTNKQPPPPPPPPKKKGAHTQCAVLPIKKPFRYGFLLSHPPTSSHPPPPPPNSRREEQKYDNEMLFGKACKKDSVNKSFEEELLG